MWKNIRNAKLGHFATVSLCGFLALSGQALGQTVDVKGKTAGPTAKTLSGTTTNGQNPAAGKATPVRQTGGGKGKALHGSHALIVPKPTQEAGAKMTPLAGDESGIAPNANTKNAGPAARTAEATAHKTVQDPNNELGTSLEGGTTLPRAGKR